MPLRWYDTTSALKLLYHCVGTVVPMRRKNIGTKNAAKSTLQFIHIQCIAKEYGTTALPCSTFQTTDDTIKADFLRLYLEYVCACAHLN